MMFPTKLHSGQTFKTAVVSKINQIIEYLKSQRVSGDNKTIKVNQQTAGLTLSVIPQGGVCKQGGSTVIQDTSYNGYFKVIDATPSGVVSGITQVRVINGQDAESQYCGQTDIIANIAATTLPVTYTNGQAQISLYAYLPDRIYSTSYSYGFYSGSQTWPSGGYMKIQLARVIQSTGKIQQTWTNNVIRFAEYWYV